MMVRDRSSHGRNRRQGAARQIRRRRGAWRVGSRKIVLLAAMLLLVVAAARQYLDPEFPADPPATVAPAQAGNPRITDGDTLRIGSARIRLQGIDAPEMDTAEGRAAKRHLRELIGEGAVTCTDTGERSYDRIVGVCRSETGEDLAAKMVADGWAVDLPRYSGGRYAPLEREARAQGRGMHSLR